MSMRPRWSRSLLSAFWLVLTAAIWIAFAPIQAGGQAAYIVVIGKSMEPNFHFGDLIIVQHESNYSIGDIVAYKNAQLKNNVFHRIIGFENNRYILKGDNNTWIDTYQPSSEEVIGKLWIYLPGAGKVIQRIRTPINMALIAGAMACVVLFNSFREKPKGGKRMNKKSFRERLTELTARLKFRSRIPQNENASTSDPQTGSNKPESLLQLPGPSKGQPSEFIGNNIEPLYFMLGLVAFATLILGIISFTRPLTVNQPDDVSYQHIGIFSYSASVPSGIYDSNTVQRGEPIFPKLTCTARVDFHYSLFGDALKDIAGTYDVTAQILEPQSGWQRTITLQSVTPFSGTSFDISTNVNLCGMIMLTEAMEQETDYHPSRYVLLITPHLTVSGKVSGRDLQDTYEPQLTFNYDQINFSIIQQADPAFDPFNQTQAGFIRKISKQANTMSLFGLQPAVLTLRLIGFFGLALSLAGMWILERYIQSSTTKSPEAIIKMRYSAMVIDVQRESPDKTSHNVDVNSMDDLAKLAERYNVMILHEVRNHKHVYYVHADGSTYRFSIGKDTDNFPGEMPK